MHPTPPNASPHPTWPAPRWRNRLRTARAMLIWWWLSQRHGWLKRALDLAVVPRRQIADAVRATAGGQPSTVRTA